MSSPEGNHDHIEFVPIQAVFDIVSGETSRSRESVLGAVDRRTGEHVGIRRPSPEFATSPDALRRTMAVDHPNTLRVKTVLRDREGIYFVTEWAEGRSLTRRLGDAPLSEARLGVAALQIGRGLRYLHDAGAAPVDLGFDQILEGDDGNFKLGGFGLHEESGEETSVPGGGRSEAFQQRVRADLRAFGRTMQRLAAGGGDRGEGSPVLPPALAVIAARCLGDDAAQAYTDAGQLVEALEQALHGTPAKAVADAATDPPPARRTEDRASGTGHGIFPWLRTTDLYLEQGEPMRGGMGSVRMAVEKSTGRRVAIKRLLPEASRDEQVMERFLREASSIANLDHPHILQLLQPGRDEDGDYLVLEWAAGGSLREKLDRTGPLTVTEVLDVSRKIGSALAFAHSKGVIHRDIKPHNILLTETGEPKLADFGLARSAGDHTLSSSHAGGGSPLYMPPEQHDRSRRADERSDLYSLGKTLYHLATGLSPSSPRAKHLPPRLRRAIMRCVEEEPTLRPASAGEFLRDLDRTGGPLRIAVPLVLGAALLATAAFLWHERGERSPDPTPKMEKAAIAVAPLPNVVLARFFADDEPLADGGETASDVLEVRLDLENLTPADRDKLRVEVLRGGEPLDRERWSSAWKGGDRLVLSIPIEGRSNRFQVRVPDLGFSSEVLELKRTEPRPSVVGVADATRPPGQADRYLTARRTVDVTLEVAKASGIDRIWLGRGTTRQEVTLGSGPVVSSVPLEEGENDFRWYWPSSDEPLGEGSFSIVADLTAPVITLREPRPFDVTNHDEISLKGQVEDAHVGDEVVWRLLQDGVEVATARPHAEANGSFQDRIALDGTTDGELVLEVATVDRAGNPSEPSAVELLVDRRPPGLTPDGALSFEPILDAERRLEFVDLAGRADEALSAVRVNGAPATLLANQRFEATRLPARGGSDAYRVVLVDKAGNASREFSVGHGIDVTPPTAALEFRDRGGVAVLNVTPSEPLARLVVAGSSVTGSALGSGTIEAATGRSLGELTTWKTGPGPTTFPIDVTLTDGAGNESSFFVVVCPVDSRTAVRCKLNASGRVEGTERCSVCGGEYCPRTGDRGRRTREDGQEHGHPLHLMASTQTWVELDCWMLDPQCRYCGWMRP